MRPSTTWILAAGVALAGCGGGGGGGGGKLTAEWKTVENGEGGYSLKYPFFNDSIGFHASTTGSSTEINKGPGSDIDCAAEVNTLAEGQSTLDDFVTADLKERKKNKGFTIVSDLTSVKVGGKDGKRVTYRMKSHLWKDVGDGTHTETVTYVLKGRNVCSLRTSAPSEIWAKRVEYFKEMHKSFALK
jgi:hypothetical protein